MVRRTSLLRTVLPVRSTMSYRWTNSGDRFLFWLCPVWAQEFLCIAGPVKGLDHT